MSPQLSSQEYSHKVLWNFWFCLVLAAGESFRLASWLQSEAGQEDRKEGSRAGCGRSLSPLPTFHPFPPFFEGACP